MKLAGTNYSMLTNPYKLVNTLKLDFGMAGFKDKENLLRGRCGTPGYVAPDILKAGVHEGYPLNVDMFSIGVVIYTLLCGYEPFYGTDDAQLIKSNKNVNYEFHLPEWAGDLIIFIDRNVIENAI